MYLDADALPLANLDHLFAADLPPAGYPFAAAPELMPPDAFATGVMVVRPSAAAHAALLAAAAAGGHDGTDQSLLNAHFADWFAPLLPPPPPLFSPPPGGGPWGLSPRKQARAPRSRRRGRHDARTPLGSEPPRPTSAAGRPAPGGTGPAGLVPTGRNPARPPSPGPAH